jgi:hypothetical protein
MAKRRTEESGVEIPSIATRVLELLALPLARRAGEEVAVAVTPRPRRTGGRRARAADAGAEAPRRRKSPERPAVEKTSRRTKTRREIESRGDDEATRVRARTTSAAGAFASDRGVTATPRRAPARKQRAGSSAAEAMSAPEHATARGEAAPSGVAEDELRAGEPTQVQVLEPPLG